MDILTYINRINQLYGDEQQVAGLSDVFPGTFTSYQDAVHGGFQGTMEEWLQQQSIPQIDRPFTGKTGGSVYDTRKYFKPGGLVEPGVTHYGKRGVEPGSQLSKKTLNKYNQIAKILFDRGEVSSPNYVNIKFGSKDHNKIMARKDREIIKKKDGTLDFKDRSKKPLRADQQAKLKERFPEADFSKGKYGFAVDSPEEQYAKKYFKQGYKDSLKVGLSKKQIADIKERFPEVPKKDWNFLTKDNPKGFKYGLAGTGKGGKYVGMNNRIVGYLEGKPWFDRFAPGLNANSQNYLLTSFERIAEHEDKLKPSERTYKRIKNKDGNIIGFQDNTPTGKGKKYYMVNSGVKGGTPITKHPGYAKGAEITKYVEATKGMKIGGAKFNDLISESMKTKPGGFGVIPWERHHIYGTAKTGFGGMPGEVMLLTRDQNRAVEGVRKAYYRSADSRYGAPISFEEADKRLKKIGAALDLDGRLAGEIVSPEKTIIKAAKTAGIDNKQITKLLQTAKTVKGSGKVKAVSSIAALVGGYTADQLLKEHGISLTQDENEKVLEAGMFPGDLIKEHPITSTIGAAATLRASKSVKGDPLKKIRRAHKLVSWPLKKIIRTAGTPLSGAGFAGWQIYDNLKAGESIADAVVDPIVGAELAFPSLLPENISKIIPDKYQNIAAKTGRKVLGLGKVIPRFMGPVGVGIGAVGSVYDAYKDYQRRKPDIERVKELRKQGILKEEEFDVNQPMFNEGGRVPLGKGKLAITGIDKGRRAFMKWLAGMTGAAIATGTGLLKWGKLTGKGTTAIKAGDKIIQGTSGMPDWFIPLVNRVTKEGTDVSKKLGTVDREIVHTKKLGEGKFADEVTVYQDMNTGNVRVEFESIHNMGEAPIQLEYRAGKVVEEGQHAGKKTKPEFDAVESEPVGHVHGEDDYTIEWDGENVVGRVEDLTSDTSKLKQFATKRKLTHKDKIIAKTKKKAVQDIHKDSTDYISERQGEADWDDYLPDIEDID